MSGDARAARIRFVQRLEPGATLLMTFADPAVRHAVLLDVSPDTMISAGADASSYILDVLIVPAPDSVATAWVAAELPSGSVPPIAVSFRGADVIWRPGRAVVCCGADQAEAMLMALVDFAFYERELRALEREIADSWDTLEQDKRLAYNVAAADLRDDKAFGVRVSRTLSRRIEHSRIAPHLYLPPRHLSAASQKLGEDLRERADVDDRLEAIDSHLEVFEQIYEMASQRLGEFRAAHAEQRLEWVIIVLLAVETVALLFAMVWPRR